eukprot:CAMPEP_0202748874 /NCGR_PEP_ID=MMETSP1388-20130828/10100_1 /ASSEMBLY_ACC=CAM_ASM_000864 /TAXON_ID=37098 /ORGANISM="Isochrysis sp, Strain CCMP1244" /LENGTH=352 /DNA_ID=CAMNT_0049416321 /DNA_START=182 /DNA_END=1242 /DNA_ORIENTATION=+
MSTSQPPPAPVTPASGAQTHGTDATDGSEPARRRNPQQQPRPPLSTGALTCHPATGPRHTRVRYERTAQTRRIRPSMPELGAQSALTHPPAKPRRSLLPPEGGATLAPARAGLAEVWDLEALRQSAVHCSRREALESRRCLVRKVADERGCDGLEGRGDPTNHVVEQAVERAEAEAQLTREILVPEKLNLKPLTPTFTPVCPFVQGEMLAVALTPTSALTVALALPEGSMLTPQAFADAPAEPVAPSDAAPALPPIDADACGGGEGAVQRGDADGADGHRFEAGDVFDGRVVVGRDGTDAPKRRRYDARRSGASTGALADRDAVRQVANRVVDCLSHLVIQKRVDGDDGRVG